MSIIKHVDYEEENERLEYTLYYLKKTLKATEMYKGVYKGNIKEAMAELDPRDSSLSYSNILVNTQFMESAERNYEAYKKALSKPYFARVDYKRKGHNKTQKIYIGKTSLIRAKDNEMIIVDWRAPIATIYYEGRLGEISYDTKYGSESGELFLKRQFTIEQGELKDIMDIDITTTDTFLQASLAANADSKLKDIASTIQAEQNRVIRAEMNKPLIVQGAAGSGKTTIALHRIAYFIYTYENTFDPENFLILAPNNLFINYISEVLPELGVEKVRQSTYVDFMKELLGNKYKLMNINKKLMDLIHNTEKRKEEMIWSSEFKGSMDFKNIIDKYIEEIENNFVPHIDFILFGKNLMSKKEIKKMFLEDLSIHPLYNRIKEIKKTLDNRVKLAKKELPSKIEIYYDKKINKVRAEIFEQDERSSRIRELADERDYKIKTASKVMKTAVKNFLDCFPKVELYDYYRDILKPKNILRLSEKELDENKVSYLCHNTAELFRNKKIEIEDYAPLVYLKKRLFGFDNNLEINNVVIDEAQDFSLFQLYTLKSVLNTNMFTLLGDLSQGIHSYRGIKNWESVIEEVFYNVNTNYMTLEQSYRTTIEVMQLANEVINKLNNEGIVLAKPVIRHGEKPHILEFKESMELICSLKEKIEEMKCENYKSIAIICKTIDECKFIKEQFDENGMVNCKILDEENEDYLAGVILVPSHLAKGLEFDVVFIVNVNETYTESDLDIKLLYVAMTRTLHRLFIYHKENTINLIKSIDEKYYFFNMYENL